MLKNLQIVVLWDVTPNSMVDRYRVSKEPASGIFMVKKITLKTEGADSCETVVTNRHCTQLSHARREQLPCGLFMFVASELVALLLYIW